MVVGGLMLVVASVAVLVWAIFNYTNTPTPGSASPTPVVSVSPSATTTPPG